MNLMCEYEFTDDLNHYKKCSGKIDVYTIDSAFHSTAQFIIRCKEHKPTGLGWYICPTEEYLATTVLES